MESFELIGMDDETFSSMPRESTPSEDLPRSPLFPPTPPEDEEHVNTNDLRVSTLLDLRNDLHGSRCESVHTTSSDEAVLNELVLTRNMKQEFEPKAVLFPAEDLPSAVKVDSDFHVSDPQQYQETPVYTPKSVDVKKWHREPALKVLVLALSMLLAVQLGLLLGHRFQLRHQADLVVLEPVHFEEPLTIPVTETLIPIVDVAVHSPCEGVSEDDVPRDVCCHQILGEEWCATVLSGWFWSQHQLKALKEKTRHYLPWLSNVPWISNKFPKFEEKLEPVILRGVRGDEKEKGEDVRQSSTVVQVIERLWMDVRTRLTQLF